jgi:hypothetical protein
MRQNLDPRKTGIKIGEGIIYLLGITGTSPNPGHG